MTNENDILDGYFKSVKQEKVDISLTDVNSIIEKSFAGGGSLPTTSVVGKTIIKLKYIIISSATIMSVVAWLFVLSSNSDLISEQKNEILDSEELIENNDVQDADNIKNIEPTQEPIIVSKTNNRAFNQECAPRNNGRELYQYEDSNNSDEMPKPEQLISATLLKEDKEHIVTFPDEHIDLPPNHDDVLLIDEKKKKSRKEVSTSHFKEWKSHGRAKPLSRVYMTGILGIRRSRVYLLDSKNTTVYNDISSLSYNNNKWAKVLKNKKYGFVDEEGHEVVKLQYDRIYMFKNFDKTWAKVIKKGLEGFIDTLGQEIVKPSYQKINYFDEYREGWALVKKDGEYGFINNKGKEVVKTIYEKISSFSEFRDDWALVRKDNLVGFINDNGEEILKPSYDKIFHFGDYQKSWAMVKKDGECGFINGRAEEIVKPIYDKIYYFGEYNENWAMVYLNKKYGFIDNKGDVIVPAIYDKIFHLGLYKEDWALVKKDGKYGFIDNKGKQILDPIYDHIGYFGEYKEDWLKVTKDGLESFINDKGVEVISFKKKFYDNSMQYEFNDDKLIIKNKKGKIMNREGE